MGCRPVAVVIMHVHKYEIRINKFWNIWLTHNIQNRQTSVPPAEFEPANPASERPQTHALDRVATAHSISDKFSSRSKGSKHVAPKCHNNTIRLR